jgi:hypothetical protein
MVQYHVSDSVTRKGVSNMEEIRKEELVEQTVELLPDREEMIVIRRSFRNNAALSAAAQGSASASNAGNLNVFVVVDD